METKIAGELTVTKHDEYITINDRVWDITVYPDEVEGLIKILEEFK